MKLTKEQKMEQAKGLSEALRRAPSVYFTQYQGLKFGEMDELRRRLRPFRGRFTVTKNSLVRHALKAAGLEARDEALLKGPVALAVALDEDPVGPVRALAAFAKDNPLLKVKGGFVGGGWLTPAECGRLSTLGSKPELLGKIAGGLYAALAQSRAVLEAPLRDLALVLRALEDKKKGEAAA